MISIHGGPAGPAARERPHYQGRSAYFLNELGVAILYPERPRQLRLRQGVLEAR